MSEGRRINKQGNCYYCNSKIIPYGWIQYGEKCERCHDWEPTLWGKVSCEPLAPTEEIHKWMDENFAGAFLRFFKDR